MVDIKDIKTTNLAWPYNIGCEHITFINVVHYMEARYGEDYYSNLMTPTSYEQTNLIEWCTANKEMMEWCTDNGVYYYGAGKEDFSFGVAGQEAMKEDRKVVLFENFS